MSNLLNDAVFFVSLCTIFAGMYKFTVTYCLKSKCEQFNLCFGLLNIKRDIKSEVAIETIELQHDLEKGIIPKVINPPEEKEEKDNN